MNSKHNEMVYGKPWIIRLLLVVLMLDVLLLGGCGKAKMEKDGSEQAETGIEESDFVYVPEFIDLKLHEDVEADRLWINGVRLVKGKVIYNLRVTNSGEQIVSNYIFTREQEDYEQKAEVPRKAVPNGEKEFVNFCSYDAEGNFYVFWEQRGEKTYQIYDFLSKYDKDYNLVYTKEVTDVWVNDNNSDIRKMEFDSNGKIYACAQNIVYVFDENGGLEKHFRLGTSQVSQLFVREDGGVYIAYMDNSADGYELKLAVLNMETGKREEPIEGLPYGCTEAWEGRNNKILLNHTGRLWEFDLETKEAKALFKWTDMYINSEQIRALNMTDTGEIIILSNVDNSNPLIPQYEIAYLKKTDKSQVMEKEVLTLATLYESDSFLTEAVARFNRGNQQYRVEIKGYMDESVNYTWENYEDAIARFQADLVSGQAGDLINLKSMDWRNLARAGALEELTPYMSSGEGVRREDFVESVVKAYELEGKCYTLPRGFIIQTLMGKETVVGAREEWSLEKIMMLAEVYPEAKVLHLGNSYMLLRFCMQYGGKAFMDYEKAECHFNTQEFIELLEFCKQGVAGQTPNMVSFCISYVVEGF